MLVVGERNRLVTYEKNITIRCNTAEEALAASGFMENKHPEFPILREDLVVTVTVQASNMREHQEMFDTLLTELKGFAAGYLWANKKDSEK